jgi:adenylosuccinate lyase
MDTTLAALSPLDGRYRTKTADLAAFFSESALMKYRIIVETEFLIALSEEPKVKELKRFSESQQKIIRSLYVKFTDHDALAIKKIEAQTNHDVKAIEYFIKDRLSKTSFKQDLEFIHFACTSEDINNLAYAMMIRDAMKQVMIPTLSKILKDLHKKSVAWKKISMLARTHGQPATPTTLGKEFFVFVKRLERQLSQLKSQQFLGKLNGATGTFAAHRVAYPEVNWPNFSAKFIRSLKLTPNPVTTQIEPHDYQAELYHNIARINTICTDLSRDIWLYISNNYFKQELKKGEVGSSTMPHKVNPIDFENAEGNLGISNTLLNHLASTLPISRMQRDLTDSTIQRNIGSAFGYSLLAYSSLLKGLGKLQVNEFAMLSDLDANIEVLAEALQTVMRRFGIPKPYEKLKELTRGKRITKKEVDAFIQKLKIPASEKDRLKKLTPANYTGVASKMVR